MSELKPRRVCALITAVLMGGLGLAASAQTRSNLPPTPPTSISSPGSVTVPAVSATARVDTAPRFRPRVTYANGTLEVHADNSSLNQILRDIARETGMKIVGGVAEQRVFGNYGPAPAATVLQTLLEGTGTNILLRETGAHAPEELVLTLRAGGAPPPPPSSPVYDATETEPELPIAGGTPPATQAQQRTPASPAMASPTPTTGQPVSGNVAVQNPPAPGNTTANENPKIEAPAVATTTTQASPNDVKTPEQIYEELKLLQQRKANPQGSPAPH